MPRGISRSKHPELYGDASKSAAAHKKPGPKKGYKKNAKKLDSHGFEYGHSPKAETAQAKAFTPFYDVNYLLGTAQGLVNVRLGIIQGIQAGYKGEEITQALENVENQILAVTGRVQKILDSEFAEPTEQTEEASTKRDDTTPDYEQSVEVSKTEASSEDDEEVEVNPSSKPVVKFNPAPEA